MSYILKKRFFYNYIVGFRSELLFETMIIVSFNPFYFIGAYCFVHSPQKFKTYRNRDTSRKR